MEGDDFQTGQRDLPEVSAVRSGKEDAGSLFRWTLKSLLISGIAVALYIGILFNPDRLSCVPVTDRNPEFMMGAGLITIGMWLLLLLLTCFLVLATILLLAAMIAGVYLRAHGTNCRRLNIQSISRPLISIISLLVACTLGLWSIFPVGSYAEKGRCADVIKRARPLIDAIEKFKAETGVFPDNLHSLVPVSMSSMPETIDAEYISFEYAKEAPSQNRIGGYELRTYSRFSNNMSKALLYWPSGNYPSGRYSYRYITEVFNGWAIIRCDSEKVPPASELLK